MSIDDKLREILNYFTVRPMPDNKQYRQGQDHIIAQIKAAFADEGYAPYGSVHQFKRDGMVKLCMTGADWYERFNREVKVGLGQNGMSSIIGSSMFELIDKAAKRASGLEPTQ